MRAHTYLFFKNCFFFFFLIHYSLPDVNLQMSSQLVSKRDVRTASRAVLKMEILDVGFKVMIYLGKSPSLPVISQLMVSVLRSEPGMDFLIRVTLVKVAFILFCFVLSTMIYNIIYDRVLCIVYPYYTLFQCSRLPSPLFADSLPIILHTYSLLSISVL